MAMRLPVAAAAARTFAMVRPWLSKLPWAKLMRAMFMPAFIIRSSVS